MNGFQIYLRKVILFTFLSVFVDSESTRVPINLESILVFGTNLLNTALCIVLADHKKPVNMVKSKAPKMFILMRFRLSRFQSCYFKMKVYINEIYFDEIYFNDVPP